MPASPPQTPDGRYIVVRGRLWRAENPQLSPEEAARWRQQLGRARSEVNQAGRAGDEARLKEARRRVHEAKVALGERGPVWWSDGSPDFNRYLIKNTPYAAWWRSVEEA